jgi:glycosyltransferase A (GT-A) superfamily protein (DUF2064 family)
MKETLLILFIRNAISGKLHPSVSRIAGEANALDAYMQMLGHLEAITSHLPFEKVVLYSDIVEAHDVFDPEVFSKEIQSGGTKGERLHDAFATAFKRGYSRVVLVMGECMEMGQAHITEAFESLIDAKVVVGPSEEGGYYLLGMRENCPQLFNGKDWHGEDVFLDTMLDLQSMKISYRLLDTLPEVAYHETHNKLSRT